MSSDIQNGRKSTVLSVGSRGFFVSTSDITLLKTLLADECRSERVGEGRYYFEFVMPFHTSAEATIHLRDILGDDDYRMVVKNLR